MLASMIEIERLGPSDATRARALFAMMAEVFEEPAATLSDAYLARLLARPDFWALAAVEGSDVVGGLTAHALMMTREEATELFIYDVAVRTDRQRRGIGRQLLDELRARAAVAGVDVCFVPAENEDAHALEFYRAIGGEPSPVTFFTFEGTR